MTSARAGKLGHHALVGGKPAVLIFVLMLLSFVVESQLTQYVETDLHFGQPYLLFYLVHSAFVFVFPLHLLYLRWTTSTPISAYITGLRLKAQEHLSKEASSKLSRFPTKRLCLVLVWCTIGITVPALLWFAAITLASVSDVTAIWNSNAFWAYVIAVQYRHTTWDPRRLSAVIAASIGVLCVVYGAKKQDSSSDEGLRAPLIGNLLTLVASVGYGFYQVAYNLYAVPESESELDLERDNWQRVPTSGDARAGSAVAMGEEEDIVVVGDITEDVIPPPPFGLYANALTCGIGAMTFLFLWIPIPILSFLSIEPFAWPTNLRTVIGIAGIAISGLTFNATFMILLSVWGPVITSVGNLLTIVLVLISDLIFGHAASTLTMWSVLGSGMIVCAFAVLAFEALKH